MQDSQAGAELIKWYGSKKKFINVFTKMKDDNILIFLTDLDKIYRQLAENRYSKNNEFERKTLDKLAMLYKTRFALDNARAILLDLANELEQYPSMRKE